MLAFSLPTHPGERIYEINIAKGASSWLSKTNMLYNSPPIGSSFRFGRFHLYCNYVPIPRTVILFLQKSYLTLRVPYIFLSECICCAYCMKYANIVVWRNSFSIKYKPTQLRGTLLLCVVIQPWWIRLLYIRIFFSVQHNSYAIYHRL